MEIKNIENLIEHQIRDLYNAENQLLVALNHITQSVVTADLKHALNDHLVQTGQHIERLEDAATVLGIAFEEERCKGIDGLIAEAESIILNTEPSDIRDAALIGAVQKIEHYEISGYGTLISHLEQTENYYVADLLKQTLAEEEVVDILLSELAETKINLQAFSK